MAEQAPPVQEKTEDLEEDLADIVVQVEAVLQAKEMMVDTPDLEKRARVGAEVKVLLEATDIKAPQHKLDGITQAQELMALLFLYLHPQL